MIYYPIPLHLQKVFKSLDYKISDFPIAESLSKKDYIIAYASLPDNDDDQDTIIDELNKSIFI